MTTAYPHIPKSFDTITPISAVLGHRRNCGLWPQNWVIWAFIWRRGGTRGKTRHGDFERRTYDTAGAPMQTCGDKHG